ncbi:unnamed protein product [Urochloa decumbens]|uniref:Uncharacterized protein n=1 Tax=Urochloa decumbens TaxID=240449 RepID=A0ABC8X2C3_9POAL
MALVWLEALGRRNVAGPLLLLNLVLYIFMMGFASWALNSFVDGRHHYQYQQQYYPPGPRGAGEEATLQFVQAALLAAVVGAAAKAATAFHARAWRPQGLAAAAALGTVAWAATALAFGLACKEMRAAGAGGVARGWRMRALEGLTTVLAITQLMYVVMLHTAVAGDRSEPGCPTAEDDQEHHRGGPTCSVM